MKPYYQDANTTILHGDCIETMRSMPDDSIDSIVTDPPYGLSNTTPEQVADTIMRWVNGEREYLPSGKGFMGKSWDGFVPPVAVWDEAMRVLKPGGHVLSFAGTRTMDLMTLGLRLAGFEIRESLAWLYGSGFPKSHDISKAIDKMGGDPLAFRRFARAYADAVKASTMTHMDIDRHLGIKSSSCYWAREDHRGGIPPRHHWETVRDLMGLDAELERLYDEAEREIVGTRTVNGAEGSAGGYANGIASHRGLGGVTRDVNITAPATDAAKQWDGWGTALKPAFEPIVLARKPLAEKTVARNVLAHGTGAINIDASRIGTEERVNPSGFIASGSGNYIGGPRDRHRPATTVSGRWPANVILDQHTAELLDEQTADMRAGKPSGGHVRHNTGTGTDTIQLGLKAVNTAGYDDPAGGASRFFYVAKAPKKERPVVDGVAHATVKPLKLMRYLVRMVTPPGGTILEPFAGSGTTIEAALVEGFNVIGIERETEYLPLIQHRINRANGGKP